MCIVSALYMKKVRVFLVPLGGNIAPTENACPNTSFFLRRRGLRDRDLSWQIYLDVDPYSEAVFFFCQDH